MKILITGGNNARALKLLKAFPKHFILFADYGEVPAVTTDYYAFASLGTLNKESIAHILLNFCITESIDCIIPLHDFEVEPLAKSAVLFKEYGIEVLLPSQKNLTTYLSQQKVNYNNIMVFIKGDCIFTNTESLPLNKPVNLNGVFSFDQDGLELKLFTI